MNAFPEHILALPQRLRKRIIFVTRMSESYHVILHVIILGGKKIKVNILYMAESVDCAHSGFLFSAVVLG